MTSFRALLVFAPLWLFGCASTTATPGAKPVYPASELDGPAARCETVCDVEVLAPTVETFCDALLEKTKTHVPDATCNQGQPLGLPTRDEAAIRDAMVVDLIGKEVRVSVLALRTARGWELAAELGAVRGASSEQPSPIEVVGARPVEAPEIAPYGVEVKVRIRANGDNVEKVFVCGKTGDKTACPRAVITS